MWGEPIRCTDALLGRTCLFLYAPGSCSRLDFDGAREIEKVRGSNRIDLPMVGSGARMRNQNPAMAVERESAESMSSQMQLIDFRLSIAEWYIDLGERSWEKGYIERSVAYHQVAARVLATQNKRLSHPRLERNLRTIGEALVSERQIPRVQAAEDIGGGVWLHVMNRALPQGGHTSMAIRWIASSESSAVHSVALIAQDCQIPKALTDAVTQSGGSVFMAGETLTPVDRAKWLRRLAIENAAVVVLHVDVDDVVAHLAFSTSGGPPVMLVNHAAHIFWVGAGIADLVLHCRGSELEKEWTRRFRGVSRYATVPIPLPDEVSDSDVLASAEDRRIDARTELGIPKDALTVLTIGDVYKFTPMEGINFHRTAEEVLRRVPNAYWVIVGVEDNGDWHGVSARTGARLRICGRKTREELKLFRDAADVYAEGFPFGSTTALLESGANGLPIVLAPANCPPPYGSDGVALDFLLVRPSSLSEYVGTIIGLLEDPQRRDRFAEMIRRQILEHHTGAGWRNYVRIALAGLPDAHRVYEVPHAECTPAEMSEYWMRFREAIEGAPEKILEASIRWALNTGVLPLVSRRLRESVRSVGGIRYGKAMPWWVLWIVCNVLLPLVLTPRRGQLLKEIDEVFRPGSRTMVALSSILPTRAW